MISLALQTCQHAITVFSLQRCCANMPPLRAANVCVKSGTRESCCRNWDFHLLESCMRWSQHNRGSSSSSEIHTHMYKHTTFLPQQVVSWDAALLRVLQRFPWKALNVFVFPLLSLQCISCCSSWLHLYKGKRLSGGDEEEDEEGGGETAHVQCRHLWNTPTTKSGDNVMS